MEKRIPAIFLTARDEEKEMLLAFDAGAQDYVVKPFSMKVLMKRLEVASKICNDASPVQVEGPIHVGVDLGTADRGGHGGG